MIRIYEPKIITDDSQVTISASFDSDLGDSDVLWYQSDKKYGEFLVTERADAFVVGLLFLGLKTGENIHVVGSLSKRLHYSLNKYLIKAICLANDEFFPIQITADYLDDTNLNKHPAAGTGMSCGVDSLATYIDHKNLKSPYEIGYFSFFNAGSHGDYGGENTRRIFKERYRRVKGFAGDMGVEAIKIDSNLSELLNLNFQKTHTLRSVSFVLLLQKLFRNFYYASSVRFDQFAMDKVRIAEYDLLNLQLLSTESTTFFSTATQYTRIERLELISDFESSYDVLDVCTHPDGADGKINCSNCDKCIRTMLILDTHDKLRFYEKVFDLEYYYNMKSNFIARLKAKKDKETQDIQVLELLRKEGEINSNIIFKSFKLKILSRLRKLKRKLYKNC